MEIAEQQLGPLDAQILIEVLADIEALNNVGELIELRTGDVSMGAGDFLSLTIGPNYEAMFVAVGANVPRKNDGRPDWTKVFRLKLMTISRC